MSSGKGSKPRNCFSSEFRANYEEINWQPEQRVEVIITDLCVHCGCRGILNTEGYCKVCEIDILGD